MSRREIRFARNLRMLRSKKGVSQEKLAEAIHVTRQTLSGWINMEIREAMRMMKVSVSDKQNIRNVKNILF